MGKKAKIKKQRKLELLKRRKIALSSSEPNWGNRELLHLLVEYWLTHDLTKSWIKSQWNLLIGDRPFISNHEQDVLVSKLLKLCFQQFCEKYGDIEGVDLLLFELNYNVAVWLDSDEWTISTGIKDNSTDEVFLTPEGNEWKLQQIPSP